MRNINNILSSHINSEVTTIATCLKLTLKSGKILAFTDHDNDINLASICYKSKSGFDPGSIVTTNDLLVDNFDLNMIISDDEITEEDIKDGLYDHSEIELFMLDYRNPQAGIIKLTKGYIGEINIYGGKFTAEVRGISYKLNKLIGQLYSPVCRAKFTDDRCNVDRNKYIKTGIITSIIDRYSFVDEIRSEDTGYFNFGIVEFPDIGTSLEIKNYFNKKIECFMSLPRKLGIGSRYNIIPGCDKSFNTCKDKYNNIINFRGEPHVPGYKYMISNQL